MFGVRSCNITFSERRGERVIGGGREMGDMIEMFGSEVQDRDVGSKATSPVVN